MDCISSNQGHLIGSRIEFRNHVYQVLMAGIAILYDCRSVIFFQGENGAFQIRDMFIGPLNFQAGISEETAHGMEFIRVPS